MADHYQATLHVPKHLLTPEIEAMIDEYIQESQLPRPKGRSL